MKYYPKSQLTYASTKPRDNFIYSDTKKKYIGPYIKTSDGKYFEGNKLTHDNRTIIIKRNITQTGLYIGKTNNVIKHTILSPKTHSSLYNIKPIPSSKPTPTKKEYELGYFLRYFVKRVNQKFGYKEISKKTFEKMNSPVNSIYDNVLYKSFYIPWSLEEDAIFKNKITIKGFEEKDVSLKPTLSQFLTILNEHQPPIVNIQENLTTEGKEFYKVDGTEYIGEYHIHPTKGPMEGPKHINTHHANLYYLDQLSKKVDKKSTIDEDYKKYIEKQRIKQIKDIKFNPIRPSVSEETRTTTPSRGRSTPSSGRSGY